MFELHQNWCLFLQLAPEKKTPILVQLKQMFGPSYFVRALATFARKKLLKLTLHKNKLLEKFPNPKTTLIVNPCLILPTYKDSNLNTYARYAYLD